MTLPKTSVIQQADTTRLIASKYSEPPQSVLSRIAGSESDLDVLTELDGLTNDRLLAEHQLLPGIGIQELLFNVPHAHIVNAAFTHAHPNGSRFNGPDRGAWYAAFEVETAHAEVAFHKSVELAEIGRFHEEMTFDAYLADFAGVFHDIRKAPAFRACLDPNSYRQSQELGQELLDAHSPGIVFPSVRRSRGTCLVCFRPALVANVRKGATYRFTWSGNSIPNISVDP
ncbi:MAG: RES family NAD+ phosphorylase [Verrucomicrobiota bacterium]